MKRSVFLRITAVLASLLACAAIASAQSAGYDLFQTGTGTQVDLSSMGVGVVPLTGNAISGAPGNTDTMVQRTQDVPSGGGTVTISVYALSLKSSSPVTFQGQSADVYVTINNTGGTISTSTLPQPDSLSASGGSVTVRTDGTFDSSLTVNADIIFVKAGTSVTDPNNYLGHGAAPTTSLASTNSSWSSTAPSGYPSSTTFPSGGFYPISVGGGGHSTPSHVHAVVPARNPCLVPAPTQPAPTATSAKAGAATKSGSPLAPSPSGSIRICFVDVTSN